jgi:hypothetical protein
MRRPPRDEEREQRITMEIIVDAYGPEEQAMGWYYSFKISCGSPSWPGAAPSVPARRCASVTRSRSSERIRAVIPA